MRIKKFNENISLGLQELIDDIKQDKNFINIEVSGSELTNFWMLQIHSRLPTIDKAFNVQVMISRKIIDISKHYDIKSFEIEIYNKGEFCIYAKILLK